MTADQLRRELDRIAEAAPTADVPDDTWSRARRSVARERGLIAAVAMAALVVVGTSVTWLPDAVSPPIAAKDALGVPEQLWAVPERMSARENDGSWLRDEVTDDVRVVGVGAAAWVTNDGLPVVVDATVGGYHLLDLPDFAGNNETFARGLGVPTVALSPDGLDLAYGYAVFGPEAGTEPIPSGVRVIDLRTGEVREIPVPGAEGTAISRIEWSPDGTWLAFAGMQQGAWTTESMGTAIGDDGGPVIGRVPPADVSAETRPIANDQIGLVVDDAGIVTWADNDGPARVWDRAGGVTRSPEQVPGLARDLGTTPDGLSVRLDGNWDNGQPSGVELARSDGSSFRVVVVDDGIRDSLSLATDLMTEERPNVIRPEPDWPWSDTRKTIVVGLAGVLVFGLLVWVRERRYKRRWSAT